jgi:hypothetical protein
VSDIKILDLFWVDTDFKELNNILMTIKSMTSRTEFVIWKSAQNTEFDSIWYKAWESGFLTSSMFLSKDFILSYIVPPLFPLVFLINDYIHTDKAGECWLYNYCRTPHKQLSQVNNAISFHLNLFQADFHWKMNNHHYHYHQNANSYNSYNLLRTSYVSQRLGSSLS